MMLRPTRIACVAVLAAVLHVSICHADAPTGWIAAGSAPADYEFSRDSTTASSGHCSALIAAKPGARLNGFGTLMQTIDATNYRGGRWKLSGSLKTGEATRAQMWMRVDGVDRKVLAFDNMDSRPVTGTTGWTRYEIVLDVPPESVDIAFGFFLMRGGKAWGDDFKLEKVQSTVPTTSVEKGMPKAPVNPDFED